MLDQSGNGSSTPALQDAGGKWVLETKQTANLIVKTSSANFYLLPAEANSYSEIDGALCRAQKTPVAISEDVVQKVLAKLSEDSGTGPDLLPTRVLKRCSEELAEPVRMLTGRILKTGVWPVVMDCTLDCSSV